MAALSEATEWKEERKRAERRSRSGREGEGRRKEQEGGGRRRNRSRGRELLQKEREEYLEDGEVEEVEPPETRVRNGPKGGPDREDSADAEGSSWPKREGQEQRRRAEEGIRR